MPLLLDVNCLLALGWAEHQAHAQVVQRLHEQQTWRTCAIVQLGFIRLSSTPGLFHQALSPDRAAAALRVLVADRLHEFVPHAYAPVDLDWSAVSGPKQSTDTWLLGLAERSGSRFLTLDRRLANAFPRAALELLG